MKIYKKIKNEKTINIYKIIVPLVIMAGMGYFLNALINENFFIGWEVYFALGCYILLLAFLLVMDAKILMEMHYSIYIEDSRLKIRDGLFSRVISIPLDRIYYISSSKQGRGITYDSIFITDKKVNHSKIRLLKEEDLKHAYHHLEAARELKDRYHDKTFYYYRVCHRSYKFVYYFYMLYKSCERCRFSDTSMEIVKRYIQ